MRKIRVLVVDDSVVARRAVAEMLGSDAAIEVAGWASNGQIALQKLDQVNPDVVTLDVEMPRLGGLETLTEIRRSRPTLPVIMLSSHTERGARITLDALAMGASDYVTKPAGSDAPGGELDHVRGELLRKVKVFGGLALGQSYFAEPAAPPRRADRPAGAMPGRIEVVALGVSTGGPNALTAVLEELPAEFPVPIVIVQHMPPLFIKLLVQRLAAKCAVRVEEAETGAAIEPGHVVVAPGDRHVEVARDGTRVAVRTHEGPRENSCRPSVDVLFRSVAAVYGPGALAVVMTGIGQDGLRGCEAVRDGGGQVWVQDEASCVVWGMPRVVLEAGLADRVVPLEAMASEMVRRAFTARPGESRMRTER